MAKLAVGQALWIVQDKHRHSDPGAHFAATVVKVGRKFAQVRDASASYRREFRIDMATMRAGENSGLYPYATAYVSREQWQLEQDTSTAWRRLRDLCDTHRMPEHITLPVLQQVLALLEGSRG